MMSLGLWSCYTATVASVDAWVSSCHYGKIVWVRMPHSVRADTFHDFTITAPGTPEVDHAVIRRCVDRARGETVLQVMYPENCPVENDLLHVLSLAHLQVGSCGTPLIAAYAPSPWKAT